MGQWRHWNINLTWISFSEHVNAAPQPCLPWDNTQDDSRFHSGGHSSNNSHSVCGKTEHPEYRRLAGYNNDISILYTAALQAAHVHKRFVTCYKSYLAVKLSTTFCAEVQPICLPDPSQDHDNQSALVTGWGRSGAKQEPIVSLKRLKIREYKISCFIFFL